MCTKCELPDESLLFLQLFCTMWTQIQANSFILKLSILISSKQVNCKYSRYSINLFNTISQRKSSFRKLIPKHYCYKQSPFLISLCLPLMQPARAEVKESKSFTLTAITYNTQHTCACMPH